MSKVKCQLANVKWQMANVKYVANKKCPISKVKYKI